MQQILNPNKAASNTDLMKEKGKKNGKHETEGAGSMMILEPLFRGSPSCPISFSKACPPQG